MKGRDYMEKDNNAQVHATTAPKIPKIITQEALGEELSSLGLLISGKVGTTGFCYK